VAKSIYAKFATHVNLYGGIVIRPLGNDPAWTKFSNGDNRRRKQAWNAPDENTHYTSATVAAAHAVGICCNLLLKKR